MKSGSLLKTTTLILSLFFIGVTYAEELRSITIEGSNGQTHACIAHYCEKFVQQDVKNAAQSISTQCRSGGNQKWCEEARVRAQLVNKCAQFCSNNLYCRKKEIGPNGDRCLDYYFKK